jgi:hypothetical protein
MRSALEARPIPTTLKHNQNLEQGTLFKIHNHDNSEAFYFSTLGNAKCVKMHKQR